MCLSQEKNASHENLSGGTALIQLFFFFFLFLFFLLDASLKQIIVHEIRDMFMYNKGENINTIFWSAGTASDIQTSLFL